MREISEMLRFRFASKLDTGAAAAPVWFTDVTVNLKERKYFWAVITVMGLWTT
jgi:hypothetical protein